MKVIGITGPTGAGKTTALNALRDLGGCIIDADQHNLSLHETLHAIRKDDESFRRRFRSYAEKYQLPPLLSM